MSLDYLDYCVVFCTLCNNYTLSIYPEFMCFNYWYNNFIPLPRQEVIDKIVYCLVQIMFESCLKIIKHLYCLVQIMFECCLKIIKHIQDTAIAHGVIWTICVVFCTMIKPWVFTQNLSASTTGTIILSHYPDKKFLTKFFQTPSLPMASFHCSPLPPLW